MNTKSIRKSRNYYRRRRVFTGEGHGHASRPRSWRILIKQVCNELIYLSMGQSCIKKEFIGSE
jgi:hypothetical protein